jgi:hypothetical protein
VRRPSPPNTYSYVQEENSGSTRKFVENHLLFTSGPHLFIFWPFFAWIKGCVNFHMTNPITKKIASIRRI